jgi:hypothetical protein
MLKKLKNVLKKLPFQNDTGPVFFDGDVFLVSYPKSGNTWLRFLVANLMRKPNAQPIDFYNVHNYCPEWEHGAEKGWHDRSSSSVYKSHQLFNVSFPKVVYILRDPRDVYVSYYHYILPSIEKKLTFADFIEMFNFPYGRWSGHVASWVDSNKLAGSSGFLLRYEDLLGNPLAELKKLGEFMDISATDDQFVSAVSNSSFESMKDIERKKGRKFSNADKTTFVRKGKSGEWKESFGELELALFAQYEDIRLMERMGYSL